MKVGFPLYLQTLGMLFLYLVVVVTIFFVSFNAQFGIGWEALLKSPIGDRVDTIADAISSRLKASNPKGWDDVLKNFGDIYHVKFFLFDAFGTQLAGEQISLPLAVRNRFGGFPGVRVMQLSPAKAVRMMPPPHLGFHTFFFSRAFSPAKFLPGDRGKKGEPMLPPPPHFFSTPAAGGFAVSTPPDRLWVRGSALPVPPPPPPFFHPQGRFMIHSQNPDRFWIGTGIELGGASYGPKIPAVVIASCNNVWQSSLLLDFQFAAVAIAVIMLLSLIFWWPFVYQITHSLSELTVATERIAEGRFDTRLKSKRRDEIGRLSEAVNSMAERLSNFVYGQKRFLGDISHELFSPIARLQLALAVLEESIHPEHQNLINDIREEVEEMNSLVQELLAFSKAGLKDKAPELTKVSLKALFDDVLSRLDAKEAVQVDIPADVSVLADPLLLERSMSNVVRNSIRYAGEFGPISVKAITQVLQVSIVVTDQGPGVPEEALKHLGEPFYRPEPSRSRSSGGAGLGLAIVKSCVEACGGTLLLRNRQPTGLEVEVRLSAYQEAVDGSGDWSPQVSRDAALSSASRSDGPSLL